MTATGPPYARTHPSAPYRTSRRSSTAARCWNPASSRPSPAGLQADGAAAHPCPVGPPPHHRRHLRHPGRNGRGTARRSLPLSTGHRGAWRRSGRRPALPGGNRPARNPQDGQRPVHLLQPGQPPVLSRPEEDRRLRRPDREAGREPRFLTARPLLLRGAQAGHGMSRTRPT